jgi:hypothetical protein
MFTALSALGTSTGVGSVVEGTVSGGSVVEEEVAGGTIGDGGPLTPADGLPGLEVADPAAPAEPLPTEPGLEPVPPVLV